MTRTCALLLAALLCSACQTMRFDVDARTESTVVQKRNSFYFWGLTPLRVNDASAHCPNGVVAIKEQTTVVDGLANLVTLGIWAPRTSFYHCAPAEGGNS